MANGRNTTAQTHSDSLSIMSILHEKSEHSAKRAVYLARASLVITRRIFTRFGKVPRSWVGFSMSCPKKACLSRNHLTQGTPHNFHKIHRHCKYGRLSKAPRGNCRCTHGGQQSNHEVQLPQPRRARLLDHEIKLLPTSPQDREQAGLQPS